MATYYTAILDRGDDGYGVIFPDVPGCFSYGDTIEEAAANAEQALALYFEDNEQRPAATPADEVTVDIAEVNEVARILIKAPEADGPIKAYSVTMPANVVLQIDRRVGSRGRSAFLTRAAKAELAREAG
ncbi:MAG: type II toxin-antitoxin system HicB family antitoxin [Alphaproteobacteria bacterium]|nr:type II toxin-antitoxin system HicB family antitoxin [Alphaproteobacteria bacterium]